ncbi:MAG: lipid-binding SYLF domain-containing protein [Phycisphaerales bacterium]
MSLLHNRLHSFFAAVAAIVCLVSLGGCSQSMVTRANAAAAVLRDFQISQNAIPESEFAKARAIAVLRASEGGVVIGGTGGQGVMVQRNGNTWSAPIALDISGGSIGLQLGGKSFDVVMIFTNDAEIDKVIRNGSYSVADASATAGPNQGQARSDDNPVRTFVRASGLFAGARVGGVSFSVNERVNNETYGINATVADILGGKVERPLGTSELYRFLPALK